eukprot:196687-Amorphochlora_amoeboformis.AAC.3
MQVFWHRFEGIEGMIKSAKDAKRVRKDTRNYRCSDGVEVCFCKGTATLMALRYCRGMSGAKQPSVVA